MAQRCAGWKGSAALGSFLRYGTCAGQPPLRSNRVPTPSLPTALTLALNVALGFTSGFAFGFALALDLACGDSCGKNASRSSPLSGSQDACTKAFSSA